MRALIDDSLARVNKLAQTFTFSSIYSGHLGFFLDYCCYLYGCVCLHKTLVHTLSNPFAFSNNHVIYKGTSKDMDDRKIASFQIAATRKWEKMKWRGGGRQRISHAVENKTVLTSVFVACSFRPWQTQKELIVF